MPLTQEQFQKARQAGFSTEQIIEFEKRRMSTQEQPQQPQETLSDKLSQQGNWVQGGMLQTAKDVATIPAHYLNQLGMNLPRAITTKMGIPYPETTNPVANIAAKGAGIAGAVMNPVGRAIQGLGKLPAGARLASKMLQGAKVGAIGGAAYTPTEDIVGIKQRIGQGIAGGITGGLLTGLVSSVAAGKKWLNVKNQLKLANEARNSLIGQKSNLVEKYGDVYNRTIKNGQGKVSLQEPLLNLINESDDIVNTIKGQQEISEALAKGEPNARRILNLVNSFIENPKATDDLSLQDADSLYKYVKNLPSIRGKLARAYKSGFEQVDFSNADRVLLNFANDIKAKVLDLAPEMNLVNREYGQFMTNYKQIRPYLKWNNAVNNFKNIHSLDPAVSEKFKQVLPKDTFDNITQMNRIVRNSELLKRIGIRVGEGAALGAVGYSIFRRGRR